MTNYKAGCQSSIKQRPQLWFHQVLIDSTECGDFLEMRQKARYCICEEWLNLVDRNCVGRCTVLS